MSMCAPVSAVPVMVGVWLFEGLLPLSELAGGPVMTGAPGAVLSAVYWNAVTEHGETSVFVSVTVPLNQMLPSAGTTPDGTVTVPVPDVSVAGMPAPVTIVVPSQVKL